MFPPTGGRRLTEDEEVDEPAAAADDDGVSRSYCTTLGEWWFGYAADRWNELLDEDEDDAALDGARRSYWTPPASCEDPPPVTGGRCVTDGVRRSYCTDG